MLSNGCTSIAEKMAKVATGSTADIKEPKAKLSTSSSLQATPAWKREINKKKIQDLVYLMIQ